MYQLAPSKIPSSKWLPVAVIPFSKPLTEILDLKNQLVAQHFKFKEDDKNFTVEILTTIEETIKAIAILYSSTLSLVEE